MLMGRLHSLALIQLGEVRIGPGGGGAAWVRAPGGCLGHCIFCVFCLLPTPPHTAAVTLRPFVSHCLVTPFVLISDGGWKGAMRVPW